MIVQWRTKCIVDGEIGKPQMKMTFLFKIRKFRRIMQIFSCSSDAGGSYSWSNVKITDLHGPCDRVCCNGTFKERENAGM